MTEAVLENPSIANPEEFEDEASILAEEEADFKARSSVSVTGPEAIIMFSLAFILDCIGWLILLIGMDDFFILDITGFFIIGIWMFMRVGSIVKKYKYSNKGGKKFFKRFGLSAIIESIPWVGGLIPSWTLAVYFEMKNNPL